MTDLTKMSVPNLLAMCDECNYPGITDELARRLAAAEAERDEWKAEAERRIKILPVQVSQGFEIQVPAEAAQHPNGGSDE